MGFNKKQYTKEFKIQALELAKGLGSIPRAAKQLGVKESTLYNWKSTLKFSFEDKPRTPAEAMAELEELRRLRRENEELKTVNYILKKAAAFFSQDHLK